MRLIVTRTLAQAWLEACRHLLVTPRWLDTTLVLHVEQSMRVQPPDRRLRIELDRFLASYDSHSTHTVAETIFPGYEYRRGGSEGVYTTYPEQVYPKIKDHPEIRWGTYAYRMLRRKHEGGSVYNPLEQCIAKMRDEQAKRAAYELGFGFGFDLATYDDDTDRHARMGGPCLSHLSFKLIEGHVHLTALYRSHYYIERAYGNLLGLARLQAFVANEAGASPGPLVCHSTMARLDYGTESWSKAAVRTLLERCEAAMTDPTAEQAQAH